MEKDKKTKSGARLTVRVGGFMVTVKPHGKTGYIVNRHGKEKPVLMWAEEGTVERFPRSWRKRFLVHTDAGFRWVGRSRGKMPAYHFLKEAEEQGPAIVEQEIGKELEVATERRSGGRRGWGGYKITNTTVPMPPAMFSCLLAIPSFGRIRKTWAGIRPAACLRRK